MTTPAPERTCAAVGCTNHVPRTHSPGRPPIYCSPACRPSATRTGLTVEIAHPDASNDGRPPERVWTVRLRRGQRTVTIADNLGWPSATALADQLQQLLTSRPNPGGAPR
jgi:hypothetical protein